MCRPTTDCRQVEELQRQLRALTCSKCGGALGGVDGDANGGRDGAAGQAISSTPVVNTRASHLPLAAVTSPASSTPMSAAETAAAVAASFNDGAEMDDDDDDDDDDALPPEPEPLPSTGVSLRLLSSHLRSKRVAYQLPWRCVLLFAAVCRWSRSSCTWALVVLLPVVPYGWRYFPHVHH